MKRKIILICGATILLLASCQKEITGDNGGGGGPTTTGGRLVMIKSKTGASDTTQIEYSYDASGRLVREKITGISGGMSLDNDFVINRNSSGIITSTVQKSPTLIAAGVDSAVIVYHYDAASSKYTYAKGDIAIPGFTVTDSTIYTYDASGKITKDEHYLSTPGFPLPPTLSLQNTYAYSADGKNVVSVSVAAPIPPSTTLSPITVQAYTLDTKVNPLIILNEAVVINRPNLYSANNATKAALTSTVDPSQDFTMDYVIKYNSGNKPDSSYGTRSPGGAVTAAKYYYQ